MKRASLLVALLGVLVAAQAVQAAPSASGFAGRWEAIDPIDDSILGAHFYGNGQIMYTDQVATLACQGSATRVFTSFLTGKVDGDDLHSTMRWARCGTLHLALTGLEITWTLDDQDDADPSNDVLTNTFEESFSRVP